MTKKSITEIGQRIAARRTALGWTQAQAAKKLGVQQSAWADYERARSARRGPTINSLMRIAKVLSVTVAELMGHEPARCPTCWTAEKKVQKK